MQVFHTSFNWCFFFFSLNLSGQQVSRTLLSILADFNSIVVSMILILLLISNCSWLLSRPLGTTPKAPTIIDITIAFMFHSFFSSLVRFKYFSRFSFSSLYTLVSWNSTIHKMISSFLFVNTRFSLLARILLSVCISECQRILCISFYRTDSGLCIYHMSAWLKFSPLHNSQWIVFLTQSCLLWNSFCTFM